MNHRIASAFSRGKAFIAFLTGGDPSIEASEEFALAMAAAGADLIEIGVPFSDPIAEGEVIQEANIRALRAGASLEKLFTLVRRLRGKTAVPIVFLTYLNPVFRAGYKRFCKRAAEAGLDGVIIPDLPFEEAGELEPFARAAGISLISLLAPTSGERAAQIARNADGFLYIVSSMGVTGVRSGFSDNLREAVLSARARCPVPAAVGFGIHSPEQAREISSFADGVIVGSAIVKIIARYGEGSVPHLKEYVRSMKAALA